MSNSWLVGQTTQWLGLKRRVIISFKPSVGKVWESLAPRVPIGAYKLTFSPFLISSASLLSFARLSMNFKAALPLWLWLLLSNKSSACLCMTWRNPEDTLFLFLVAVPRFDRWVVLGKNHPYPELKALKGKKKSKCAEICELLIFLISQVCLVKMAGYQLTCTALLFCYSHDSLLRFHEVILSHLYRPSLVNEESIIDFR